MNSAGVIVGGVRLNDQNEPVVWQSIEALPTILQTEGRGGSAAAINSAGQVVGLMFGEGQREIPTAWENEKPLALPDFGDGGQARDISESGVIVGFVNVRGKSVACRWVNRELQLLPLTTGQFGEGESSIAESINSSDVISGTVRKPDSTESLAVRWEADGIKPVLDSGLETKGISIDNLGGVLVNGYFDGGYHSQPARVLPDGTLDVLKGPAGSSYYGVAMSRMGVACGYYFDASAGNPEEWSLKAVAWVGGEFTALELPAGNRYAIPLGVGINGVVIGNVSSDSSISTPGFWSLPVPQTELQSRTLSAAPGQTVRLMTLSSRASGVNVGQSVQVSVPTPDRVVRRRLVTNTEGLASMLFTIPARTKSGSLVAHFTDETGARGSVKIRIVPRRPIGRPTAEPQGSVPYF